MEWFDFSDITGILWDSAPRKSELSLDSAYQVSEWNMSTFHAFSPLILTASQSHMLGSINRLILLTRKQRPKEVKQLSSGYTIV